MRIGDREIGVDHPPYVIAEIGVNHDGEVARALELTDAAADAGADAVKLQFFETDRLMSKAAKLAAYQKNAGETDPIEMLRRLELTIDEMAQVVDRAHERGIHAIVTVFSTELVKIAETLAWDAYKTASPDLVHWPLLKRLKKTKKPLIISTGAADFGEICLTMSELGSSRNQLAFLHCVSSYPTPPEMANLVGVIALYNELDLSGSKHRGSVAGYSDHTIETDTGSLAVQAGASILEKHLTYSTHANGPDHRSSLEPSDFAEYVRQSKRSRIADIVRQKETKIPLLLRMMHGRNAVRAERRLENLLLYKDVRFGSLWKDDLDHQSDVRDVSRQSLVASHDLRAGEKLRRSSFVIKRPGTGISPSEIEHFLGKRCIRDIEADTPIMEEDLQ